MSDIMGSISTVKKFFSKEELRIEYKDDHGKSQSLFELEENRIYIIPKYQREIRWKTENIIELMTDIRNNQKFLGNFILSKVDGGYSIIDGQQRITSLLLLYRYINWKYSDEIGYIDTCKLKIESFKGFEELYNNYFDEDKINKNDIEKTDDYNQMERYISLWKDIDNSALLNNKYKAKTLLGNLEKCEINIIISKSSEDSIDYFLDVNLKGIKLDNEDIFKSYLFAQNKTEELYNAWIKLKRLSEILNKKKAQYPLMKIIEHYFYSDLYNYEEYSKIEFDEDFLLKNEFEMQDSKFYKGQHLLKVILSNKYLLDSINKINSILEYITSIITDGYGDSFKSFFNRQADIDDIEKQIIYSIIKNIIRDSNKIPKVMIMKYMLDICKNKETANKKNYKKIYIAYITAVCFNIFEDKKSSGKLYNIVKSNNWDEAASKQLKEYFKRSSPERLKINFTYKYNPVSNLSEIQVFRCKSLACIYNYFRTFDDIGIIKGKIAEVNLFLNDNTKFSIEHLLINDSGKCKFNVNNKEYTYSYPSDIIQNKYKDSIANYIFIPKEFNSGMKNTYISEKIKVLKANLESNLTCDYSKMIINLIDETFNFPEIDEKNDEKKIKENLDIYYSTKFKDEYAQFLQKVIMEVYNAKFCKNQ